jgi:hypothetical protein
VNDWYYNKLSSQGKVLEWEQVILQLCSGECIGTMNINSNWSSLSWSTNIMQTLIRWWWYSFWFLCWLLFYFSTNNSCPFGTFSALKIFNTELCLVICCEHFKKYEDNMDDFFLKYFIGFLFFMTFFYGRTYSRGFRSGTSLFFGNLLLFKTQGKLILIFIINADISFDGLPGLLVVKCLFFMQSL